MTAPVWEPPPPRPPSRPPRRAEVVVVGGGITGVAALRALLDRGVDAVLLERQRLGSGATGRNAGFLLSGVAENYAVAVDTLGRQPAGELWALTMENHDRLLDLAGGAGCGHARRGSVVVATSAAEDDDLRRSATLLAEDRLPGRYLPRPPHPLAGDRGCLVVDVDGEVDPAAALAAAAAPIPDARICENVVVHNVDASGDVVRLDTSSGDVEASGVVLAVNAHLASLLEGAPVKPVRAQMLATAPWATVVATRPTYAHRGYRYWRQRADGRVLVGGWRDTAVDAEVGDSLEVSAPVQGRLEEHLHALGVEAAVTHRWAGTMGFTPDALPLVGQVPGRPRVVASAGYTGHGMGMAVCTARLAVEALLDGARPPGWLDAGRLGWGRRPADGVR